MQQNLRCGIFIFFSLAHAFTALPQVTATVVKDIRPGGVGSEPKFLTLYNNAIYFSAVDGVHGRELWKSDGTEAGTVMVKDIRPGSTGSDPEWLAVSNGVLYFSANDGVNGGELWRSDGTEAGTVMVTDLTPNNNTYPFQLTDVDGVLFFAISNSNPVVANRGLWKSDGTAAGTVKVAGTYNNTVGSGFITPTDLVNVNGTLFFIGQWPSLPSSTTLWKSDGTEAGTVMVSTNTTRFMYGIQPAYLAALNNEVYFAADIDTEDGGALWKSDGTEAGTLVVRDMDINSTDGGVQHLTNINNTLYFSGFPGASANTELWKSDGTSAGTVFVKDINPGSSGSNSSNFTDHAGRVYFVANTADYGYEIWATDGTETGTVLVADLYPEAGSTFPNVSIGGRVLIALNGNLYFRGFLDNGLGEELYKLNETILPVRWEELGSDCVAGSPRLNWKTAIEINTKDFIVQASSDAVNWVNRDTVAAAGNSHASVTYQYTENNARSNYRYYRVMQRDIDGKSTYSKVLNISCGSAATRLSVFPNPANNIITLTGIESRYIRRIEIVDMAGRSVMTSANKQATVDISALSKGLYILRLVKKDAGIVSQKFIKQ
ncbi:ELWxxDGT repeat protein [Agriterribacter sp.]|uniref:ELWxxDGT repeat protein n=1 Tax=Agriterribacter sp. TaxID=2821509 RepID=UPI002B76AD6E|nr:ELWxxDGT repeat protein [Agriterribacter sp.]HRO46539.1 T9SS type A sorting domain-containing protein [Agriterribacter sp.]HRQ17532.1 T9SS type A sorting domain-containing protein [Agriterribacter sp.]